jgi:hypothetical protein
MWESKLSKTAYPIADPSVWLTGDKENLDPVFAGRIAYVGKSTNTVIKITKDGGYRTHEIQAHLYAEFKAGKLISADIPGRSWHEYGIAADTSTQPIRGMSNTELKKYGLVKPINKEGWHIQPIETLNQTDRIKFAPVDLIPLVKKRYSFSDSTINFLLMHPYPYDLFKKLYEVK